MSVNVYILYISVLIVSCETMREGAIAHVCSQNDFHMGKNTACIVNNLYFLFTFYKFMSIRLNTFKSYHVCIDWSAIWTFIVGCQ